MDTLNILVKITASADSRFTAQDDVIRFLSDFDGGSLPDNVTKAVYKSFIISKDYADHKKLVFRNLCFKVNHGNNDQAKLQRIMIRIRDELRRRFNIEVLSISGKSNFQVVWKKDYRFECLEIDVHVERFLRSEITIRTIVTGRINRNIVKAFNVTLYKKAREIVEKISGGPKEVDTTILGGKSKQDQANFIFIRSLLDFINTASSESFSLAFADIDQTYPFLFRPCDTYWDKLLKKKATERNMILGALLLRARGLTRQRFENVIDWWVNMIVFLREKCDGNAGNFFRVVASKLGIDRRRNDALEVVQNLLESFCEIRDYVGITFPFSLKAGRLFFTMMTKSDRGFDLMNDVSDEHVKAFNLPVDAQVLRVALNTRLIDVKWVKAEKVKIGETEAKVLVLQRSDMTELAQVAWKLIADNIGVPPVELDYLIYSVGSLVCNRFGNMCYACPITDVCYSWGRKKIAEGSGVDWNKKGMFSYGKGGFDALVFRPCSKCKGCLSGCRHKYPIRKFSSKQSKIDSVRIAP